MDLKINDLPDCKISEVLSSNPGDYKPGIFQKYINEAQKRGIKIPINESEIKDNPNTKKKSSKSLISLCFILAVFSFGIFSIIPATILKKKNLDGDFVYCNGQGIATLFQIFSAAMILMLVLAIVFR